MLCSMRLEMDVEDLVVTGDVPKIGFNQSMGVRTAKRILLRLMWPNGKTDQRRKNLRN